jgi:hypothetical protein
MTITPHRSRFASPSAARLSLPTLPSDQGVLPDQPRTLPHCPGCAGTLVGSSAADGVDEQPEPRSRPLLHDETSTPRRPNRRPARYRNGRTATAPDRRPLAPASSAIASVSTALHAPSRPPRQGPSAPQIRRRQQSRARVKAVYRGAPESVLLLATSATAACLAGATSNLVAFPRARHRLIRIVKRSA